jgi:hypothetical protein
MILYAIIEFYAASRRQAQYTITHGTTTEYDEIAHLKISTPNFAAVSFLAGAGIVHVPSTC